MKKVKNSTEKVSSKGAFYIYNSYQIRTNGTLTSDVGFRHKKAELLGLFFKNNKSP
jgi:hypothetical protein